MRTFEVLFACVAMMAEFSSAAPPPSLTLAGEEQTYIVARGDHLYELARSKGLAYAALARANGIADPNMVQAGAVLTLPTRFILPDTIQNGLIVNIPEYRLYVLRDGAVNAVYPIAIGLPTWQSPVGSFSVTNKVQNPAWYMPPDMAKRENIKREIIAAGPDNPLGDYWIGTSLNHTGIHGTNRPMSIGRALSHGCMRMYPEHIEELFNEVAVGDSGEIVYEPIKISAEADSVLIEIHPDIYDEIPDLTMAAEQKLRHLGLWERVDARLVRQAVDEARGIPIAIQKR